MSRPLKALVSTAWVAIVATLMTLAIGAGRGYFGSDPFAPLYGPGYTEQQVAADVVVAGQRLESTATKCSRADNIGVTGTLSLRKLQPPPLPAPVVLATGARIDQKGCVTRIYSSLIPADTPPGTYELVGAEQATDGKGRMQLIVWHSEPFEVRAP